MDEKQQLINGQTKLEAEKTALVTESEKVEQKMQRQMDNLTGLLLDQKGKQSAWSKMLLYRTRKTTKSKSALADQLRDTSDKAAASQAAQADIIL